MYYRPAIKIESSVFYIQPPLVSWSFSDITDTVIHTPPKGNRQYVLHHRRVGRTLRLGGIVHKSTASAARTELELLEQKFAGGLTGKFSFYVWHDRFFKDVVCTSFSYDRNADPSNIINWTAELQITDPTLYSSPTIGSGPYESAIPSGDLENPPTPPEPSTQMAVFPIHYSNVLNGNYVYELVPTIPNSEDVNVFQVAFLGCIGFDSTGNTVIRVNKSGVADGTGVALTVPHTAPVGEAIVVSCDIDVNLETEHLYVLVESYANKPVDMSVSVYVKALE